MATQQQQGTGQHKHKSTEEPFPHHEAPTAESGGRNGGEHRASGRQSQGERRSENGRDGSDGQDLKSREYTDPDGEVHHHTRTYEEQHKGENSGEHRAQSEASGSDGHSEKRNGSHSPGAKKGGNESPEERHTHQEEGARKRGAEIRKEHGH